MSWNEGILRHRFGSAQVGCGVDVLWRTTLNRPLIPMIGQTTSRQANDCSTRAGLLPLTAFIALSASLCLAQDLTPAIEAGTEDVFEDTSARAGLHFVPQFCHDRIANIILSNGAGGAVLDYDNDGWVDVYFLNWGPKEGVTKRGACAVREPNRLFRNKGDGTFEDVTKRAGVGGYGFGGAAAAGDFDNDGFTDLFIANLGRNQLLRNRGDGTFEDVTDAAGVGHEGAGISAVFLDADRDGYLDLYLCNYLTYKPEAESEQNPGAYPGPLAYPGEADVFYRNMGDGTFKDVTREVGLYAPQHRGMSVSALDADRDGDTDLYISNDDTPNGLWINDGRGHFKDVAMEVGVAFNSIGEAPGSMNAAIADADGNGLPDIFVTRLGYGSLYLREGQGLYADRMWASGLGRLTQEHVGWGGVFLDYDNDADPDIAVVNGSAFVLPGSISLLLENNGKAQFSDASQRAGAFFGTPYNGRGNAVLDYDNDGRLDLVLTGLGDRSVLLRNRSSERNHWIKLRLEGVRSNRNGYGALLTLVSGDLVLHSEAQCPVGFLMQSDARVHFGLGERSAVDRIEILWPSGIRQVIQRPEVDRVLNIKEPRS